MVYCTKCGAANDKKKKFCKNCGTRLHKPENNFSSKKIWIAAIVISITGIIAVAFYLQYKSSNHIASTSSEINFRDSIQQLIVKYYQTADANDCSDLTQMYVPVVETYYTKHNITPNQIEKDCNDYYNHWTYHTTRVEMSSINIQPAGDDYNVVYHLNYKLRKNVADKWKTYFLTINAIYTKDYKIKSIYEIEN